MHRALFDAAFDAQSRACLTSCKPIATNLLSAAMCCHHESPVVLDTLLRAHVEHGAVVKGYQVLFPVASGRGSDPSRLILPDEDGRTARVFIEALSHGEAIVMKLLAVPGAVARHIHETDSRGRSPLLIAASSNLTQILVSKFLQHGAAVDQVDGSGRSALALACDARAFGSAWTLLAYDAACFEGAALSSCARAYGAVHGSALVITALVLLFFALLFPLVAGWRSTPLSRRSKGRLSKARATWTGPGCALVFKGLRRQPLILLGISALTCAVLAHGLNCAPLPEELANVDAQLAPTRRIYPLIAAAAAYVAFVALIASTHPDLNSARLLLRQRLLTPRGRRRSRRR